MMVKLTLCFVFDMCSFQQVAAEFVSTTFLIKPIPCEYSLEHILTSFSLFQQVSHILGMLLW